MLMTRIKGMAIQYGGYRTLRWAQDNVLDRSRRKRFVELGEFYRSLIKPGDLCFDVGSNIGDVSAVLLDIGATVVAIDPQHSAMRELRARFGSNRRLTCVETALGSKEGTASLYLHDQIGTSSLVSDWQPGKVKGTVDVKITTLDTLVERFGVPKYCKIDVEGYEIEVLKGLNQAIALVSLEFHREEEDLRKLALCLERLAEIQRIKLNVIPHNRATFACREWLDPQSFQTELHRLIKENDAFSYGDVFVRPA